MNGTVLVLIGVGLLVGVFFARAGRLGDFLLALAITALLLFGVFALDNYARSLLQ